MRGEQIYKISSRAGRAGVGMSGTSAGIRVYALTVDRSESDEVAVPDSPNFGVCLRACLDKIGDIGRKLSTARSSVVRSVKCAYIGCNATNRDRSHSSTSKSLGT